MPHRLFAVSAPGLEEITAGELRGLGVRPTIEPGGVGFNGSLETLYAANLHLRTASRILLRLGDFEAAAFHELERRSARVPWAAVVGRGGRVRVRVTCRKSRLYHSDAVAQRVLAAIDRSVGGVSEAAGGNDDESDQGPVGPADAGGPLPQLIVVRVAHDRVTVSADSSGALLHLRGYRKAVGKAPLRETLAAAMLLASEWDPATPLVDPMCGSGTIAIEGALLARRIAPGLARGFAFQSWADFDAPLWETLSERARRAADPATPAPILGSDRDAGAISAAIANAERAGVTHDIVIGRGPLSAASPPGPAGSPRGAIVTNPPYGARLGDRGPLRDLHARLGQVARAGFPGWKLAFLSADRSFDSQVGLDLEERFRTRNGGIPVRLLAGTIPL